MIFIMDEEVMVDLLKSKEVLEELQGLGVDNWDGYSDLPWEEIHSKHSIHDIGLPDSIEVINE